MQNYTAKESTAYVLNWQVPDWLSAFADYVIVCHNMDESHNQVHFNNTVDFAKHILASLVNAQHDLDNVSTDDMFKLVQSTKLNLQLINTILMAAYCHDLIDTKYIPNEFDAINALENAFLQNGYNDTEGKESLQIIVYIITHISFSKRRKRELEGLPLFEDHTYKFAAQIVCDADQLEAYRVERVEKFQTMKHRSLPEPHRTEIIRSWCKTILVKRILRYKDCYFNTQIAREIAGPLHDKVQKFVDATYQDVEMFEY